MYSYQRNATTARATRSLASRLQELAREVQQDENKKSSEISNLRSKVYKLEDEVETLQETIESMKEDEEKLQEEIKELKETHKTKLDAKDGEIRAEKTTVSELQREVLALRFELAAYRHESHFDSGSESKEDVSNRVAKLSEYSFPDTNDLYLPRVLLSAARKGLSSVVSTMLDVNPRKERTELMLKVFGDAALQACAGGHYEVAKTLLDSGADVNSQHDSDAGGRSLLHYAVVAEQQEFLDVLLSHPRVNFDVVDARGRTPLHLGARLRKVKSVQALIKKGVDLEIVTPEGFTAKELATNDSAGGFSRDFYSADRIKQLFKDRNLLFWNYSTRALQFYKRGHYSVAMEHFGEAVNLNAQGARRVLSNFDLSRLLFNKAKSAFNCGQVLSALEDLNEAIELKPDYSSAVELRARCYFDLYAFDKAASDLINVQSMYSKEARSNPDSTNKFTYELQSLLTQAKKCRDATHYEVLGIRRSASSAEIKQAFRTESRKWHPDKQQSKDDAFRSKSHFQRINEGKMVLLDAYRRRVYDQVNGFSDSEDEDSDYLSDDDEYAAMFGTSSTSKKKHPWRVFTAENSISHRQAEYRKSEEKLFPAKPKTEDSEPKVDTAEAPTAPSSTSTTANPSPTISTPVTPEFMAGSTTEQTNLKETSKNGNDNNETATKVGNSWTHTKTDQGNWKATSDFKNEESEENEESEDETSSEEESESELSEEATDSDAEGLWHDEDLEASVEWLEARMKSHLEHQEALRKERELAEQRVKNLQSRWKQEREYLRSCGIVTDSEVPWHMESDDYEVEDSDSESYLYKFDQQDSGDAGSGGTSLEEEEDDNVSEEEESEESDDAGDDVNTVADGDASSEQEVQGVSVEEQEDPGKQEDSGNDSPKKTQDSAIPLKVNVPEATTSDENKEGNVQNESAAVAAAV